MMKSDHDKTFTYSGLFGVGIIYLVALVILTVSFIVLHYSVAVFGVLIGVLTVICAILATVIYLCSRHIAKINKRTKTKLENGDFKEPRRGKF